MPQLPDIQVSGLLGDDPQQQIQRLIKQLNEWGRQISNESRTSITKDDSGTQRLLIGYQQNGFNNGNIGVKMSQEGVDVLTATDNQLIFSTEFNSFKIKGKGTGVIPSFVSTAGISRVTIPHNQPAAPIVQVFAEAFIVDGTLSIYTASRVPLPVTYNNSAVAGNYFFSDVPGTSYRTLSLIFAVDNTNIYVQAGSDTALGAFTFKNIPFTYYILEETAV